MEAVGTHNPIWTGGWELDPKACLLKHTSGYFLDLLQCRTSAEVLDWIFQVSPKRWCGHEGSYGLLKALDDILRPQETLCSNGVSSELSVPDIRARVQTYLDKYRAYQEELGKRQLKLPLEAHDARSND